MGKQDFIDQTLAGLREKGLYNTIRTIESANEAWVQIEGKRVLNLCSTESRSSTMPRLIFESMKMSPVSGFIAISLVIVLLPLMLKPN